MEQAGTIGGVEVRRGLRVTFVSGPNRHAGRLMSKSVDAGNGRVIVLCDDGDVVALRPAELALEFGRVTVQRY